MAHCALDSTGCPRSGISLGGEVWPGGSENGCLSIADRVCPCPGIARGDRAGSLRAVSPCRSRDFRSIHGNGEMGRYRSPVPTPTILSTRAARPVGCRSRSPIRMPAPGELVVRGPSLRKIGGALSIPGVTAVVVNLSGNHCRAPFPPPAVRETGGPALFRARHCRRDQPRRSCNRAPCGAVAGSRAETAVESKLPGLPYRPTLPGQGTERSKEVGREHSDRYQRRSRPRPEPGDLPAPSNSRPAPALLSRLLRPAPRSRVTGKSAGSPTGRPQSSPQPAEIRPRCRPG